MFGRKADSPVHTRRGEGPSFQMLGEPPRAGAGRDLRCGVPEDSENWNLAGSDISSQRMMMMPTGYFLRHGQ